MPSTTTATNRCLLLFGLSLQLSWCRHSEVRNRIPVFYQKPNWTDSEPILHFFGGGGNWTKPKVKNHFRTPLLPTYLLSPLWPFSRCVWVSWFPSVFLTCFRGKPLGISGTGFFIDRCPPWHPTNTIKALKETHNTEPLWTQPVARPHPPP